MHLRNFTFISAITLLAASVCLCAPDQAKPSGSWKKLPLPALANSNNQAPVRAISTDRKGNLWAIIDDGLYLWNGSEFVKNVDIKAKSNERSAALIGGGDRDLYVAQITYDAKKATLWKLSDGSATQVTEYPVDNANDIVPVYVSKSGKLYNWASKYLAVYDNNQWKRIETNLHFYKTLVFETDDTVYFFYNGTLCSADDKNSLTSRDVTVPLQESTNYERFQSAVWGKERALISSVSGTGAVMLDLKTGEVIPPPESLAKTLAGLKGTSIGSMGKGSVLISGWTGAPQRPALYVVDANGAVNEIDAGAYATDINAAMKNLYMAQSEIDGSYWLGLSSGILQIRKGEMVLHDWHNGMPFVNISTLKKGPGDIVYSRSLTNIYAYSPTASSDVYDEWSEYTSDSSMLARDSEGRVWIFLSEQPGKISCWDDGKWTHYDFPGGRGSISYAITDDCGHTLIEANQDKARGYDVSPDGIKSFESIEDALLAAVARGAKSFDAPGDRQGCILTDDGRIVFSRHLPEELKIWDGKRWGQVKTPQYANALLKSSKYGFLVRSGFQELSFSRYDKGLLEPVDFNKLTASQFVIGAQGVQPYDEELLKSNPNDYFTGEPKGTDRITVRLPGGQLSERPVLSDFNYYFSLGGKGYHGGLWSSNANMGKRLFLLGDSVIECSFENTPLENSANMSVRLFDDRQGNLWAGAGYYLQKYHVFMRKNKQRRLKISSPPQNAVYTAELKLSRDSTLPRKSQLFWNVDDGQWSHTSPDAIKISFPSKGEHKVKLIAVDSMGCAIAVSPAVTIMAEGDSPTTKLAGKGPFTVTNRIWKLPVTGSSSFKKAKIGYRYRIDSRDWLMANASDEAIFNNLKPGYHKIEAAAMDNGAYADPNPVSFDITYAPDWEETARRILTMFGSPDQNIKNQALAELKELGPGVIPELRRQLDLMKNSALNIYKVEDLLNQTVGPSK